MPWGLENDDTVIDGPAPLTAMPPPSHPMPVGYVAPQAGLLDAPPPQPSRKTTGKGVAAILALSLFGFAVLAGGTIFAAGLLRGDNGTTTTVASPEPTPSPTPSVPSLEPAPDATVTVTATATATAAPAEPADAGTGAPPATESPQATATKTKASTSPTQRFERFYPLGAGDYGYVVEALQRILTWRGVRTYVDGDFGNATERSVRQWQAQNGLSVTGMVDDTTWESLLPKLKKGSFGGAVTAMQQVLWERGYTLEIDGDFGAQTDRIVREFQRDRGLTVDGIVGPVTWAALLA